VSDEAVEVGGFGEGAIYPRRRNLDEAVVPLVVQHWGDPGDHVRAELVVHGAVLPVHNQGQKRPAGEAGLDELRPLREGALYNLRQSV